MATTASCSQASLEVNAAQRQMVIQKLQEKLFILKGRTIGLLGLAFKPDTDDLRDAPSLHIAERLLQMGARVKAYDPIAMNACREQHPDLKIRYCESALEVASEADALVWSRSGASSAASTWRARGRDDQAVLVDGRNIFRPEQAIAAGFDYSGVGRVGVPGASRGRGHFRLAYFTRCDSSRMAAPTVVPSTCAPGITVPVTVTRDPRDGTPVREIT